MNLDRPQIGWHPAPNGLPELWYFDGREWVDPIQNVQDQITELIIPHLEHFYREGFKAGAASVHS